LEKRGRVALDFIQDSDAGYRLRFVARVVFERTAAAVPRVVSPPRPYRKRFFGLRIEADEEQVRALLTAFAAFENQRPVCIDRNDDSVESTLTSSRSQRASSNARTSAVCGRR